MKVSGCECLPASFSKDIFKDTALDFVKAGAKAETLKSAAKNVITLNIFFVCSEVRLKL